MSTVFQAIRVVGGVVPPALLGRIQANEVTDSGSLAPASYHLAGSETARDAASRSWSYLRAAWDSWRAADDAQGNRGAGTGAAREKWLLVLLRELGYGQVPTTAGALTAEGTEYPISHIWTYVPVHLLGPRVDLDKKNPGVTARAPQSMVQEFLNKNEEYLWGILSNGLKLRLLRDSTALAGSAYLEFDLETIFDSELYPEFQLLWQVCHQSRLEKRGGPEVSPADCWLESWRSEAVDAGARALDKLRDGVEEAIGALGAGYLKHPANGWLVEALRSGELPDREFHKALLRTVYRLLFCFVAEDRSALLDPKATTAAHERYAKYFSTQRVRRLSRQLAGTSHPDLWQTQKLVLEALGGQGLAAIAIPALGGLFDPDPRARILNDQPHGDLLLGTELANTDFLAAIHALGWVRANNERSQPVDYRHLGAEELGSVYESLLELVPRVDTARREFTLERLAGNERKTTGSYYTPPKLVSALLDTALDPLLDDAVKNANDDPDAERRLLALTVCDPASGSGGFLVAAARRIARRLAGVRTGEDEPTPQDIQHALHDVVGQCIYGVDMNDLAAELAKVSLWLEALEPGKPLGFLDARIKIGNSLLGVTPALLAGGVPNDAFKDIEGDDKKYAAEVRKRNHAETPKKKKTFLGDLGQDALDFGGGDASAQKLIDARNRMLSPVDTVEEARVRAREFAEFDESEDMRRERLHADAWCAAFVWPLNADAPLPPTSSIVRQLGNAGEAAGYAPTITKIRELAQDYRFFHWHLEFPEVFGDPADPAAGPEGWPGGFSCMLGNPPWERVKLQEQEYFAARDPEIVKAPNAAARQGLIKLLATEDPTLFSAFLAEKRRAEGQSTMLRASGRYPFNGRGDVNTYSVFVELFRNLTGPMGRSGVIVPTGIATDATTQFFFKDLVESNSIAALYDFENRGAGGGKTFEGVDSRQKFCLLTMGGRLVHEDAPSFAFFLHDPADISISEFSLTPEEIKLINPNTGTLPIFRTRRDAEITLGIYSRVPVLINENDPVNGNPWGVSFMTMFHMSNDSHLFHTREQLESDGWVLNGNVYERTTNGTTEKMLPLYEAKMLTYFDHRAADVVRSATAVQRQSQPRYLTDAEKTDPNRVVVPMYWVASTEMPAVPGAWLSGFADITSATNERTLMSTAMPVTAVGNKFPLYFVATGQRELLMATMNSFVLDYVARQKLPSVTMNYFYLKQFAVLNPSTFEDLTAWGNGHLGSWLSTRIRELIYTAWDMEAFADEGTPFVWDASRRAELRSEIDAAFFHLYGVSRHDAAYILDTFSIVKRKDEAKFGEYRTKRLILEVFDAMQTASDSGTAYQTILDPPPGQGPRHPAKEHSV